MTVLHWIVGYLTFPAALLRAFLEHIFLKAAHVPVEDTDYMQKNELFGHVEHKPVSELGKSFCVSFLPGLILFLSGAVLLAVSGTQLFYLGLTPVDVRTGKVSVLFIVSVVLFYLGASLCSRMFPTYEDALYLWEAYTESDSKAAKILLFLPVVLLRAGAFLERFCLWTLCIAAASVILFLM